MPESLGLKNSENLNQDLNLTPRTTFFLPLFDALLARANLQKTSEAAK